MNEYDMWLKKHKNEFTVEELEKDPHLNYYNLRVLLAYQKLTVAFCAKHILNPAVQTTETEIDVDTIIMYQPHITEDELYNELQKYSYFTEYYGGEE